MQASIARERVAHALKLYIGKASSAESNIAFKAHRYDDEVPLSFSAFAFETFGMAKTEAKRLKRGLYQNVRLVQDSCTDMPASHSPGSKLDNTVDDLYDLVAILTCL